jgi:hypothetical protein
MVHDDELRIIQKKYILLLLNKQLLNVEIEEEE